MGILLRILRREENLQGQDAVVTAEPQAHTCINGGWGVVSCPACEEHIKRVGCPPSCLHMYGIDDEGVYHAPCRVAYERSIAPALQASEQSLAECPECDDCGVPDGPARLTRCGHVGCKRCGVQVTGRAH